MATFTTLAAVKTHLGITGTSKDAALQPIVDSVNQEMLNIFCLDDCAVTSYTERHDIEDVGQSTFGIKRFPVVAVTELKNSASVVNPDKYGVRLKTGHVRLDDGCFVYGRRKVTVTFTAGWVTVPSDLAYAALVTAASTWTTDESPGLESETIGRYKYKKQGAGSGGAGTLLVYPTSASRILAGYRRLMPVTSTLD